MAVSTEQHQDNSQMSTSFPINLAERLESVKAGATGAIIAGLVFGIVTLVKGWSATNLPVLAGLLPEDRFLFVGLGGVLLSGFLFGVTYRYVVRQDQNSHLGEGAVLAFALVRGMAQVEAHLDPQTPPLPYLVLVIESIVLFALIRLVLEVALSRGWVKTFKS